MKERSEFFDLPDQFSTTLIRSRDMVHLRSCYQIRGRFVNPWYWAEGKSVDDIADSASNGIKFCQTCNPLAAIRVSS